MIWLVASIGLLLVALLYMADQILSTRMNRCKTCKHFKSNPDESPLGNCGSEKFVHNWQGQSPAPMDGLEYSDYEGYQADLLVGPEFGCIHHAEKASA